MRRLILLIECIPLPRLGQPPTRLDLITEKEQLALDKMLDHSRDPATKNDVTSAQHVELETDLGALLDPEQLSEL